MLAGILTGFQPMSWREVAFPTSWPATASWAVLVPFLTLFGWQALCYARSPLRRYPGPFFAGTYCVLPAACDTEYILCAMGMRAPAWRLEMAEMTQC